jgi:hypothetical protein
MKWPGKVEYAVHDTYPTAHTREYTWKYQRCSPLYCFHHRRRLGWASMYVLRRDLL